MIRLWRLMCGGFDQLGHGFDHLFRRHRRHISLDCQGRLHDVCQAERDRTRADGHGVCCRTDANRCEDGCHSDGPIEPEPAGGHR